MKLLLNVARRLRNAPPRCASPRCFSSPANSSGLQLHVPAEELVVGSSQETVHRFRTQVEVRANFISEEEETALMQELELGLKKKRYEFDHWDDVRLIIGSQTDMQTCSL